MSKYIPKYYRDQKLNIEFVTREYEEALNVIETEIYSLLPSKTCVKRLDSRTEGLYISQIRRLYDSIHYIYVEKEISFLNEKYKQIKSKIKQRYNAINELHDLIECEEIPNTSRIKCNGKRSIEAYHKYRDILLLS